MVDEALRLALWGCSMTSSSVSVRLLGLDPAAGGSSPDKPAVPAPVATATKARDKTDLWLPVLALVVVVVVWRLAVENIADGGFSRSAAPAKPVEGLTIFAVFFVAASGLERLLEPFSVLWGKSKDSAQAALKEAVSAAADYKAAVKAWSEADTAGKPAAKTAADAASDAVDAKLADAAKEQANASRVSGRAAVGVWAMATVLGILASASLKLYLLKQVGIADPPRDLEILATGVIIGSGTKPLHDLVQLIEKKKETAATAAATATAT